MQQKVKLVAMVATICFATPAFSETCDELEELYYHQDKIHSYVPTVMANGEEYFEQLKAINNKQIILKFMDKQKCPYPDTVKKNYNPQALKCPAWAKKGLLIAIRHGKEHGYISPSACDMSRW